MSTAIPCRQKSQDLPRLVKPTQPTHPPTPSPTPSSKTPAQGERATANQPQRGESETGERGQREQDGSGSGSGRREREQSNTRIFFCMGGSGSGSGSRNPNAPPPPGFYTTRCMPSMPRKNFPGSVEHITIMNYNRTQEASKGAFWGVCTFFAPGSKFEALQSQERPLLTTGETPGLQK